MQSKIIIGYFLIIYFVLTGQSFCLNTALIEETADREISFLRRAINLTADQAAAIRPILIECDTKLAGLIKSSGSMIDSKRLQDQYIDDKMQELGTVLTAAQMDYLLNQRMIANEAYAKNSLQHLAMITEAYANTHGKTYPASVADLLEASKNYITETNCDSTISGYMITCSFARDGYTLQAQPMITGTTGKKGYTVKTGGVLTSP